jgi:hypothetical protein
MVVVAPCRVSKLNRILGDAAAIFAVTPVQRLRKATLWSTPLHLTTNAVCHVGQRIQPRHPECRP